MQLGVIRPRYIKTYSQVPLWYDLIEHNLVSSAAVTEAGYNSKFQLKNWHCIAMSILRIWDKIGSINSSPPKATYMCQWTGSLFVQVMACRLFGAKPLPEQMLIYCQLDYREQVSVKFESEFYHFHSTKSIWKCCLSFCPGVDELKWHHTVLVKWIIQPIWLKSLSMSVSKINFQYSPTLQWISNYIPRKVWDEITYLQPLKFRNG